MGCQQSSTEVVGRISARYLDDEVREMVGGNEKRMLESQTVEEQSMEVQDMAAVHALLAATMACDPVAAEPILPSWREYAYHDTEYLSGRRHLYDSVEVLIDEDSEYHASCC
jgi:hypothetical protein